MSAKAKAFLYLIWGVGLISFVCGVAFRWPQSASSLWEPLLFLFFAIVFGQKKITLTRRNSNEQAGSMSLGFALTFAAMLRFGLTWGILVGTGGCLASCVYPKRQAYHQIAFNVALTAFEGFAATLVYLALNHWSLKLTAGGSAVAIALSAVTYFMVNTMAVAVIIGLCTDQSPYAVWNEHFLVTAPPYFYGAGVSALAIGLLGERTSFVLLALSPIAYLTFLSFGAAAKREAEKQQYIEDLQVSQHQLAELYLATIKSLALAIDAKDQYTHQHIIRVQRYAVATGRALQLDPIALEAVNTGALLHDIGKLGVPEYVLLKPGRLTTEEYDKIKQHPEIGAAILDPVEFPWPVLSVVKYHHEKWDGSGYPEGLKGEAIPFTARILAVADVYDALTSTRSYRNAWTHERALNHIQAAAGKHFDTVVVEAFKQVIESVINEMATEGIGPLAPVKPAVTTAGAPSKAVDAVRQIQRTSTELFALYEVAQTLSSSLGLYETLNILVWKLEAIFPGTTCLFMLRDELLILRVGAVGGLNRDFFKEARALNAASPSVQAVVNQKTYYGPFEPDDLLLTSTPASEWQTLKTALIVPIVHQGNVLGTINLYHTQADAFGVHECQLLETIAERAAMPIYNGLLFDRTRSHAITDPLTGLHNVRFLTEFVEERFRQIALRRQETTTGFSKGGGMDGSYARGQIAEDGSYTRSNEGGTEAFALLCLDVDSFKPINDNFGHQRGDQVLRDLSQILRGTVRAGDLVARYGGDEFVVLLNGIAPADARMMGERLQRAVEAYDAGLIHERLGALKLGISVGVACYPTDGTDWETLLAIADARMYQNKTDRKLGRLAERPHAGAAESKDTALTIVRTA